MTARLCVRFLIVDEATLCSHVIEPIHTSDTDDTSAAAEWAVQSGSVRLPQRRQKMAKDTSHHMQHKYFL